MKTINTIYDRLLKIQYNDAIKNLHLPPQHGLFHHYLTKNEGIYSVLKNFRTDEVPRSGEFIYRLEEIESIVKIYHQYGKQIGVHVAGEEAIQMTLEAGVDVLHHAHGITNEQIKKTNVQEAKIVTTPMGGTHLEPNSPENILKLVENKIDVSIATDAFLPPYQGTDWLPFKDQSLQGPDVYMKIAHPGMGLLQENGFDENEILALLAANPAAILRKGDQFGELQQGMDANFLVTSGVPGLEITDVENLKVVYFRVNRIVDRLNG